MKRIISIIGSLVFTMVLVACGNSDASNESVVSEPQQEVVKEEINDKQETEQNEEMQTISSESNILVVNFSCTGNTKPIAKKVASYLNADFYEIIPAVPYTEDDINYHDDNCRANKEQSDDSARPEIAGEKIDMSVYATVIISFPIWWGKEPKIIDTFMESYDFSGKTLTCFCTSGGSDINTAEANLQAYVPEGTWLKGIRFHTGASENEICDWINTIGVKTSENEKDGDREMIGKMNVQIGDYNFTVTLENNDAVSELIEMMKEGPVVLNLDDYSGFEKVGALGRSLTSIRHHTCC